MPTSLATPCRCFWSNRTAIALKSCSSNERNWTCDNSLPMIGMSTDDSVSLSLSDSVHVLDVPAESAFDSFQERASRPVSTCTTSPSLCDENLQSPIWCPRQDLNLLIGCSHHFPCLPHLAFSFPIQQQTYSMITSIICVFIGSLGNQTVCKSCATGLPVQTLCK
jgi:hypothetical protein